MRPPRMRVIAAAALAAAVLLGSGGAAAQADAARRERFNSQCLACHGEGGGSRLALTPSLAGQHAFYAITQLFLFREGRRDNPAMTEAARGMSDADLQGFADLIALLPPAAPPSAAADPVRLERGRALAQRLHCIGCHGADGSGGRQVPRVAHQREDYLLHALQGFRAGRRVGYTPAMNEALAGSSPQDLEDLAHFMAHWPGTTPAR